MYFFNLKRCAISCKNHAFSKSLYEIAFTIQAELSLIIQLFVLVLRAYYHSNKNVSIFLNKQM